VVSLRTRAALPSPSSVLRPPITCAHSGKAWLRGSAPAGKAPAAWPPVPLACAKALPGAVPAPILARMRAETVRVTRLPACSSADSVPACTCPLNDCIIASIRLGSAFNISSYSSAMPAGG